jgi:hypothetical protein
MQGVQNLLRFLPYVAFRTIELFGPFLRIFEPMMEGPVEWAVTGFSSLPVSNLMIKCSQTKEPAQPLRRFTYCATVLWQRTLGWAAENAN